MRQATVRTKLARAIRRLRGGAGSAAQTEAANLFAHLRLTGSSEGIDDLALAATGGRWRLAELLDVLGRGGGAAARATRRLEPHAARDLAMLLADLGLSGDARTLFAAMIATLGPRSIGKEGRFTYAELLVEAGDVDDLDALLDSLHIARDDPAQPWLFSANASNPFRSGGGATDRWLDSVNAMFAVDGLEPISIAAGDGAPFDRIDSMPSEIVEGPLVTVVIPTYSPGPRIATAIESLLAQSYRSLQILIMDDASPADSAADLERWRERDPRIEIVHLDENNGPYLARNLGVAEHARGEFITIHDDDDWSHPRKIERQVAHLRAEPSVVANMCNGVRASDDLWFGRVNGNPVWTQQALSSLMVRRTVFDRIGYWDVLNRSADAEFNDRIRSWTGGRIPVVGRAPLMFYRMRWGSLSDGEFRRGYMDPRRRWYFHSYRAWHDAQRAQGVEPYSPIDNRACRVFSVPDDLIGSRAEATERRIDVDLLVVSDFRRTDDGNGAIGAVADALRRGDRVGILQLDSHRHPVAAPLDVRILELAGSVGAHVVSLRDNVRAAVAEVHELSVFETLPRERAAVVVDRLVLPHADAIAPATRDACLAVFGAVPEPTSRRVE